MWSWFIVLFRVFFPTVRDQVIKYARKLAAQSSPQWDDELVDIIDDALDDKLLVEIIKDAANRYAATKRQ